MGKSDAVYRYGRVELSRKWDRRSEGKRCCRRDLETLGIVRLGRPDAGHGHNDYFRGLLLAGQLWVQLYGAVEVRIASGDLTLRAQR